ncbi:MAG TPA: hypothetical protein VFX59_25350 [Polyangiales bacterium]|nr:hypothetical protein [Polyangiales bacterium]
MHEHATGALRDIDRIAHGAMRDAARHKRKTVDREAVERVLAGRMPIALTLGRRRMMAITTARLCARP